MIKHIILWQLRDDIATDELQGIKENAKAALESLQEKIDGLLKISVNINGLETSNADMMLDTSFESYDALRAYAVHPEHVRAADTYVRPFTKTRLCLDYEE